ncbi:Gfo/Idh/MocA family protein [Persicitalea jodogahamensis]|uniref:Oxidoreductase n=1 Tax=Persicitalea jodogahamensis TaxID=402147 RepID=A0A8J3G9F8_9BACT|nr:Gfo/Idh/MocA family oxidoreductase [Persicitalea jodogahamensis]GHB74843.1 oxidoreductase [Persicitalea jodogahamensis]
MDKLAHSRRSFIEKAAIGSLSLGLFASTRIHANPIIAEEGKRVGIIGLDTSHSTAFTKVLNAENPKPEYMGYKVVTAYPYGSRDIETSASRIPGYIEEVRKYGVQIADSIDDLLKNVDVVLLETNDGRLHLEQATQVLKAGKRVFIDKPIAASLQDVLAIFQASKKYKIPLFSASSLRYTNGIVGIDKSKVVGADTFSPASLEKTHPDLFWYGIHAVEPLFTVMGTGCREVVRVTTPGTDIVVGTWNDGRVGTIRGTRTGKHNYGGTVYTQEGEVNLGPYAGYEPLLIEIIKYFETGKVPVQPEETIEMFAFMEAADESKRRGGSAVSLESVLGKAQ